MSRKLCLISAKVGSLLVKQLAHELKNYNLYKTFANYFAVQGIMDLQKYYNLRADEELLHHQWIFDFLSEGDYVFTYPAIPINELKIETNLDPFTLTVNREIETTQLIYDIYEQALAEKDYMTAVWLQQHLIPEQVEEENTSRTALAIMEEDDSLIERAEKVLKLL